MAESGLQEVHFLSGNQFFTLKLTPELSRKLTDDKDFATEYFAQVVKSSQEASARISPATPTVVSETKPPPKSPVKNVNASVAAPVASVAGEPKTLKVVPTSAPIPADMTPKRPFLSQTWPKPAVSALIKEVKKHLLDFYNPKKRKKEVWMSIGNAVQARGFIFSWESCEKKWRNLKQSYTTITMKNAKAGPNAKWRRQWDFYEPMQEVLEQLKAVPVAMKKAAKTRKLRKRLEEDDGAEDEEEAEVSDAEIMTTSSETETLDDADESGGGTGLKSKRKRLKSEAMTEEEDENMDEAEEKAEGLEEMPVWFSVFLKEFREVEERKIQELRRCQEENLCILKERNLLLEKLNGNIEKLLN